MKRSDLEREKLAALAEWAAGAGHEINNPLAVIAGRAQLLLDAETNPSRRHDLALIVQQALRIHEMIADLMLFARPPELRRAPCSLSELVEQVVGELQPQARLVQAQLEYARPHPVGCLLADADHLAAALRALCENALEAVGPGGTVQVELHHDDAQPPGHWQITVADDGPGISPDMRRHLFEPFFSGRAAGRGVGMGLAKCWRIVTLHGGRIEVDSRVGRGARFTIVLPNSTAELPPCP